MKSILQCLICILLLTNCTKTNNNHDYGFYYWRSTFNLNKNEQQTLNKSKVGNLYTRFFDVVKQNDQFLEVGIININKEISTDKKIVPVIFITNETWFNIKPNDIQFLAVKINERINKIHSNHKLNLENEIQIDSDWTASTKNDYFKFLQALKQISKKNITCTLRLHQVKDKLQTGIPPVDKMYLMCYATSSPLENQEQNSILDVRTLKSYLRNLEDYPIKLDIALPIYSWGIVTNHLGKKKLINALTAEELMQNKNFKMINKNNFEVLKDDFYFGLYLNKGFKIKIEEIAEKDIIESLNFIDGKLDYPFHIIYYHLDERFTKNYNTLFQ
ncbi:hypothetical protein ACFOWU_12420 [Epilithonimonas zeae]|uniref:Uncharacterized protein n=1 Tax=Epilithonimonas zeae TaxID=1416779 RepID=A0A1N6J359_9FLAO|nr:hypothetical protein [Epilithonimonas zeae]SIO38556.1 hypothetical protein SAMN05444409_3247 [Epilithonimonas zeae]